LHQAPFEWSQGLPASGSDPDHLDHVTTIAISGSVGRSGAAVWTSDSSSNAATNRRASAANPNRAGCDIIEAVRRRNPVQVRSGPATVTSTRSRKSGRLPRPAAAIGDRRPKLASSGRGHPREGPS
jgi:hypothetical protein